MKLISMLALAILAAPCLAQTGSGTEQFSAKDLAAKSAALAQSAKGPNGSTATLGDYKSHIILLSVRTASGKAEVHAHYDDVFVVTEGEATLITGGTVPDGQTGADSETRGSQIQDGKSQAIAKGDVIHIPAGTPHQLIIAPGDTFSAIVVKVRE